MAVRRPLMIAINLFGVLLLGSLSVAAAPASGSSVSAGEVRAEPVVLVQCCEGGSRPGKGCGVDAACPGSCTAPATAAGDRCEGDHQCGRCEGPTGNEATHGVACHTSAVCAGACSNDPSIGCVPASGEAGECPAGGRCEAVPCAAGTCGDLGTCTGLCERPREDVTPTDPASAAVGACP